MKSKSMEKSGASRSIVALKAKQKNVETYTTYLTADKLWNLVYTLPKSKDNPDELERKLSSSKAKDIAEYVAEPDTLLPNNIIVNLTATDNITIEPVDEEDGLYRLDFTPIADSDEEPDKDLPEKVANKYGYVVDGQHRGFGVYTSAVSEQMPLVVTALMNAPKEIAFKTFADINETQTKVPKLLTTYIRHEIQDVTPLESDAYDIAEQLNLGGPLEGKIQFFQDQKGSWIKSPTMIKEITPLLKPTGVLYQTYNRNKGDVTTILKEYFKAVQEAFDYAWGQEDYVLSKSIGMTVILRIFPRIYRRCNAFEAGKHHYENFLNQLNQLDGETLVLGDAGEVKIPMKWQSQYFASYSSGAGINQIVEAIHAVLPEEVA